MARFQCVDNAQFVICPNFTDKRKQRQRFSQKWKISCSWEILKKSKKFTASFKEKAVKKAGSIWKQDWQWKAFNTRTPTMHSDFIAEFVVSHVVSLRTQSGLYLRKTQQERFLYQTWLRVGPRQNHLENWSTTETRLLRVSTRHWNRNGTNIKERLISKLYLKIDVTLCSITFCPKPDNLRIITWDSSVSTWSKNVVRQVKHLKL